MRILSVNTSAYINHFLRSAVGVAVVGIGLSWPRTAEAEYVKATPHRLDFAVTPGLPLCNDEDAYRAIVTNWIPPQSLNPTVARKIVVRMKALRGGGKRVVLTLLDAEGQTAETETHTYPPDEECFRILYWTAFDTLKLLKRVTPSTDPPDTAPVPIDELVKAASQYTPEKPAPVKKKSAPVEQQPRECPVIAEVVESPARREPEAFALEQPKNHLLIGAGVAMGLTRAPMAGVRLGIGRMFGPLMVEVDARVFPPLFESTLETTSARQFLVKPQAYLATAALCARRAPLVGCLMVTGGAAGYSYTEPAKSSAYLSGDSVVGGAALAGFRLGAEFSLGQRWALRFDMEGQVTIYQTFLELGPAPEGTIRPTLAGFVSVLPRF